MSVAARQQQSCLSAPNIACPSFVTRRMDEHYVTRVEQLLGGEHLHVWKPAEAGAIMLAGNDYLCISGEPDLLGAQARCLQSSQAGLLMSSVFLQEGSRQHQLEAKLAGFMGAEDGVLAQSGWAANVGLMQSIAEPGVPVYLDMLAHASLWEGVQSARSARASRSCTTTPATSRARSTSRARRDRRRCAVQHQRQRRARCTKSSTSPNAAASILIVDESHSLGTHGPRGAGIVAGMGLEDRVHFRTASLAKAFAGRAGFITCSSKFKGYFLSASRPAIFSSCLLEHELAWFDAALDLIAAADAAPRRAARQRAAGARRPARAWLQRRRRHRTDHRAGSRTRTEDAGAAQGAGAARHLRRRVLRPGHRQEPLAGAPDAQLGPEQRRQSAACSTPATTCARKSTSRAGRRRAASTA